MMKIDTTSSGASFNIAALCPHCKNNSTFEGVSIPDVIATHNKFGVRRCPRSECRGYLFIISDRQNNLLRTFPNLTIDFDSSNVPEGVERCLAESIECHAHGSNIAAAIMVRKTLEEICHDKNIPSQNDEGKKIGLKKKIEMLGNTVVIPTALVKGMDNLLILGNDAAHIEAQVYAEIGTQEVEIAIKFTKEIIKSIYQYDSLLEELQGLSKTEK